MPKPQNILGQKFGRLSVIEATEEKEATDELFIFANVNAAILNWLLQIVFAPVE